LFLARVEKGFPIYCPRCGEKEVRKKAKIIRKVRHCNIGEKVIYILIQAYKYFCCVCQKYFNQRYEGILPRRKYTEAFRREIVNQHQKGIAQSNLGKWRNIGAATIERWYQEYIKRKSNETDYLQCSKYIGIDEHFFSKKKGFVTTLCNLSSNKILDILPGKSLASLESHLKKLKDREKVEMVCMDLSDTYKSIVKKYFPKARIVADRFHVIRLINHHFLKTWQIFDPEAKYSRGLLSLMRRHRWHLKEQQKSNFYSYMDGIQGLKPIYDFKQNLTKLLLIKNQTQRQVKKLIPKLLKMIKELQESNFEYLVRLGNTLNDWIEELVCMWRYSKNNSITEGFHRKMKLIQRLAYGFKNFDNYRLRVRALCCGKDFILK